MSFVSSLASSLFSHLHQAPVDPILGTATAYRNDASSNKVNLGVGAYRDDDGNPVVFKAVLEAQKLIANMDHEYSNIDGVLGLKPLTQKLLFGRDEPRIVSAQSISGTGALRLGAEFASVHLKPAAVYIPDPSWETHRNIFLKANFEVKIYPYYDKDMKKIDIEGLLRTLNEAVEGSLVLLHACAHNPTGMDPSQEQWEQIFEVLQRRKLIPFVDAAYQGFASGDLEADSFVPRTLLERGFEFFVAQSFAKNFGLYGERVGMIHIVCSTPEISTIVLSQLKLVIRPMYSNPPIFGARLVEKVLSTPELFRAWETELKQVAGRIGQMRIALTEKLEQKTGKSWSHITSQIGMFSYTGLTEVEVEKMINKWHIYLLKSGRISLAGLNTKNLDYVVDAIVDCTQES
jgi:aspartate/tyrosine/aromatic aminotransferase